MVSKSMTLTSFCMEKSSVRKMIMFKCDFANQVSYARITQFMSFRCINTYWVSQAMFEHSA